MLEESDRERVFQTAAWIWMGYLVCLAAIDLIIYAGEPIGPILWYHLVNGIPALLFLGLAYTGWLKARPGLLAPVMLLLITAVPILVFYLFNFHLPPAPLSNVEGMVLRHLPILLLGMILVAWYTSLPIIVFYSLGINLFELALVFGFSLLGQFGPVDFAFIILTRTVCLIVVGVYINRLVTRLRTQADSLKVANTQLAHYASTLEGLTVSRERNRMSRELHDTVVHTLSGLSVQLETTKAYWDVDPKTAQGLLDQSLEATRSGLQETRRAIKALRASPLDDLGLIEALRDLANTAAQRGRFSAELDLPDRDPVLSPDVTQCIYRVAQEAVENVVHHAGARNLCLKFATSRAETELSIQDDGIGFNPNQNHLAGHYGLSGMRERAELVGGELIISSHPGSGSTVKLVVKRCLA